MRDPSCWKLLSCGGQITAAFSHVDVVLLVPHKNIGLEECMVWFAKASVAATCIEEFDFVSFGLGMEASLFITTFNLYSIF